MHSESDLKAREYIKTLGLAVGHKAQEETIREDFSAGFDQGQTNSMAKILIAKDALEKLMSQASMIGEPALALIAHKALVELGFRK